MQKKSDTGHSFTLGKEERLKSRKLIERVFREGKSFALFPFRVYYFPLPAPGSASGPALPRINPADSIPVLAPDITPDSTPSAIVVPAKAASSISRPFPHLQAGFGASSRNFKKAVDRNRIKRLSREAYRLQKQVLYDWLREKDQNLAVFFIYTGKELPDYEIVREKIGLALQKLRKITGG